MPSLATTLRLAQFLLPNFFSLATSSIYPTLLTTTLLSIQQLPLRPSLKTNLSILVVILCLVPVTLSPIALSIALAISLIGTVFLAATYYGIPDLIADIHSATSTWRSGIGWHYRSAGWSNGHMIAKEPSAMTVEERAHWRGKLQKELERLDIDPVAPADLAKREEDLFAELNALMERHGEGEKGERRRRMMRHLTFLGVNEQEQCGDSMFGEGAGGAYRWSGGYGVRGKYF